jgi:hypothetical protein
VAHNGLMWDSLQTAPFFLRIHVSVELKYIFTAKQNECCVDLSFMHTKKSPIHKIKSCFIVCFVDFVNHSCQLWSQVDTVHACMLRVSYCREWSLVFRNVSHISRLLPYLLSTFCNFYILYICVAQTVSGRWLMDSAVRSGKFKWSLSEWV